MEETDYSKEFAKWFWGDNRCVDDETGKAHDHLWEAHLEKMKLYDTPYKYILKLLKEELE